MAFSRQRGSTTAASRKGITDVTCLHGFTATIQRDRLGAIREIIAALPRGHACAVEDVAVARRVDDDFRGNEFAARFRIDDDAFAMTAFHNWRGGDTVKQQLDAFAM